MSPRPVDDNATTDEETSVNINVLATIRVSIRELNQYLLQPNDSDKGSVTVNPDNTIRFTPVKTYNGPVTFTTVLP